MAPRDASAIGRRPRLPRLALLAAIVAVHLAAILILLSAPLRSDQPDERVLTLFDVRPPPPPPTPPQPPSTPSPVQKAPSRAAGGGSPGLMRQRAAIRIDRPRPPLPSSFDATIVPDLPAIAEPVPTGGTASIDLGAGGAGGVGTGSGSGRGAGSGSGSGDGGQVRYARAEWISPPSTADFTRLWPRDPFRQRVNRAADVLIACFVRSDGRPFRCKIVREQPRGLGFGRSAIDLAGVSRVRPVYRNDVALKRLPVLIPIAFYARPDTDAVDETTAAASALPAE